MTRPTPSQMQEIDRYLNRVREQAHHPNGYPHDPLQLISALVKVANGNFTALPPSEARSFGPAPTEVLKHLAKFAVYPLGELFDSAGVFTAADLETWFSTHRVIRHAPKPQSGAHISRLGLSIVACEEAEDEWIRGRLIEKHDVEVWEAVATRVLHTDLLDPNAHNLFYIGGQVLDLRWDGGWKAICHRSGTMRWPKGTHIFSRN